MLEGCEGRERIQHGQPHVEEHLLLYTTIDFSFAGECRDDGMAVLDSILRTLDGVIGVTASDP